MPAAQAATSVKDFHPHFFAFDAHDERCPQISNTTLSPADQSFTLKLIVPEPQPAETYALRLTHSGCRVGLTAWLHVLTRDPREIVAEAQQRRLAAPTWADCQRHLAKARSR